MERITRTGREIGRILDSEWTPGYGIVAGVQAAQQLF